MLIRKLDRNTFDVFGGCGWPVTDAVEGASSAQWTRFRRFHWGFKQIAGTFLPRPLFQEVVATICNHPDGSLENV
jgi:hypothetical protein